MFFILGIVAIVFSPIRPGHHTFAMKKGVFELPSVNPSVRSNILPSSVDLIVLKVASIFSAVAKLYFPIPLFHAVDVGCGHLCVVRQKFLSASVVHIVLSKTLVPKAIRWRKFPESVGFVLGKITLVSVPLGISKHAYSAGLVCLSIPLIDRAICVLENPFSLAMSFQSLTLVYWTIFKDDFRERNFGSKAYGRLYECIALLSKLLRVHCRQFALWSDIFADRTRVLALLLQIFVGCAVLLE